MEGTVVFFGSARSMYQDEFETKMKNLESKKDIHGIAALEKVRWMCAYCEQVQQLASALTEWAIQTKTILGIGHHSSKNDTVNNNHLMVSTGGGYGFMEAANRGTMEHDMAKTMGMLITLPYEKKMNSYVSSDLGFQYDYFFTRKFWLLYHCKVLIVAPGGFGTLDELFEVLTLKCNGKIKRDLPIVLYGKQFWNTIINWQSLIDYGVISQSDFDIIKIVDSVSEAFQYITQRLHSP